MCGPVQCKPILLLDIWRTCNKIRAAIFRCGVDLWAHYLPLDPEGYSLVSGMFELCCIHTPLVNLLTL